MDTTNQVVYVLTYNYYDYHKFTDLLFASTELERVIKFYENNKQKNVNLYYNSELTEVDHNKLSKCETRHYLITEF